MIKTLERIAADPKMQEEEFAALDAAFWQNALAKKDNALAKKDKEITELRRLLRLN